MLTRARACGTTADGTDDNARARRQQREFRLWSIVTIAAVLTSLIAEAALRRLFMGLEVQLVLIVGAIAFFVSSRVAGRYISG
jgi:hypothetical protein